MANRNKQKRIIITGTRKGIGRELTEYYLQQRCRVAGCSRGESDLRNGNYLHCCLDVGNEEAVKKMILEVKREMGGVDILINNAGIASMNHAFLTPQTVMERIYRTNSGFRRVGGDTAVLTNAIPESETNRNADRSMLFATMADSDVDLNIG